ncbi:hypothetical protein F2P81_015575 [Scophthalmus maximus]|uniref:Uncharacterized protein n=1 Tax=Scophthalmus maximus TaxID=52904 RepID=A0A6A4SL61_SCOMX|nr:hypothetical protein F2P81_015575 [Scophthalmus maximus]
MLPPLSTSQTFAPDRGCSDLIPCRRERVRGGPTAASRDDVRPMDGVPGGFLPRQTRKTGHWTFSVSNNRNANVSQTSRTVVEEEEEKKKVLMDRSSCLRSV